MQYPQYQNILFAIPNAARRTPRIGAYMKDEGMLPGVADLIFLKSKANHRKNGKKLQRKMEVIISYAGRLTNSEK